MEIIFEVFNHLMKKEIIVINKENAMYHWISINKITGLYLYLL